MAKVCIYTTYDIIMGGDLGANHVQLTTVYDVTENPDGPGLVCELTEHRTEMDNEGFDHSYELKFRGDLERQ